VNRYSTGCLCRKPTNPNGELTTQRRDLRVPPCARLPGGGSLQIRLTSAYLCRLICQRSVFVPPVSNMHTQHNATTVSKVHSEWLYSLGAYEEDTILGTSPYVISGSFHIENQYHNIRNVRVKGQTQSPSLNHTNRKLSGSLRNLTIRSSTTTTTTKKHNMNEMLTSCDNQTT